ncbi:hypothetical protein PVAND_006594 [Polypedilum vanderplanki]|uniref:Uncharacterized protein n=1 Tax=Polypedilum vanderplanki TaxID=319348 RepID=A0A9J6C3Q8_POLVA|nr:hypothetical protein PVAND_006594 [Polypedilum vanderplanki]
MSRRKQRSRGTIDDDSDEIYRENTGGGSLQRPLARSKHSNIKLDDDVWSSGGGLSSKYWKQRPASAGGKQSRNKEIELRSNYATIRHPQQQYQQRRDYNDFEDDLNDFVIEQRQGDDSNNNNSVYYARKKYSSGSIKTTNLPTPSSSRSEKNLNEYSSKQLRYSTTEAVESESEDDNFEGENRMSKKTLNVKKSTSKDIFKDDSKEQCFSANKTDENFAKKTHNVRKNDYRFEDHHRKQESANQLTHASGGNKFSMEGFESDFNTSPKQQMIRSQQEQKTDSHKFTFEESEISPSTAKNGNTIQQKLRFNENVSISKFDKNAASSSQQMFEDDFLQSWSPEISGTNANVQMQSSLKKSGSNFSRQENIKKSDSINIFARKVDEDPFANDDFFNSEEKSNVIKDDKEQEDPFEWENDKNNFANFDNKNI